MGVFGEVAKFLWFLCDSIKEEPDACYIMATEFTAVGVPIMMMMEPEWSFKKAEVVHTASGVSFVYQRALQRSSEVP